MARRLPSNSRKLLVASIGVAAVSYVACSDSGGQSPVNSDAGSGNASGAVASGSNVVGNLMPMPLPDGSAESSAGSSAGSSTGSSAGSFSGHFVGNLMPTPFDSSVPDGSHSSDAADGGQADGND